MTRSTPGCCCAQVQGRRKGMGLRVSRSSLIPSTRPHRDSSDNSVTAPPLNAAELGDTQKPIPSDLPVVEAAPPQWPIAIGPNSIPFILETPEYLQYSEETFSVRIRVARFFYL